MAQRIPDKPSPAKKPRASAPASRNSPTGRGVMQYSAPIGPKPMIGPPAPKAPAKPGSGARIQYGAPIGPPAAPRSAPAPRVPSSGGTSGIGTSATGGIAAFAGGGGDMGGGGVAAPTPPPMSQDQYLAQDAEFLGTQSDAEREYQNLIAQLTRQRGEYELDNKNTLRNMGWGDNGWNQTDRLTGYGQAYQNQLGDFASRGILDSSLYGGALNDLNRGFNRQRDDLQGALSQFLGGQEQERTQAEAAKTAAITAAQRQAIARYAAQFGVQ